MSFVTVQAPRPPVGLLDVRTSPLLSTATHCLVGRQLTPVTWTEIPPFAAPQEEAASGLVEDSRFPPALPATQSTVAAHETPCRSPGPPGVPSVLHAETPPVGLVETRTPPCCATATQRV